MANVHFEKKAHTKIPDKPRLLQNILYNIQNTASCVKQLPSTNRWTSWVSSMA